MSDFMGVNMDVPTEVFLLERYKTIVAGSELPQSIKDLLNSREPETMEELDEAYAELIYMLQHIGFYSTLAKIEKGEQFMSEQSDPAVIARCRTRLNELSVELEGFRPKENAI